MFVSVDNYPEVVVRRDGDCVEILPSSAVPEADLVLNNNDKVLSLFPRPSVPTWSAQQTKFPSRSRET